MKPVLLPLLAFSCLMSAANAALIAYDGFDYAAGSLNGASGGTGWTANWTSTVNAAVAVPTTSLSYNTPGGVSISGGATSAVAIGGDSPLVHRTFATQTATVYFSFLFRYESGGPGGAIEGNDFLGFALNNDTDTANSGSIGRVDTGSIRFGTRIGGTSGGVVRRTVPPTSLRTPPICWSEKCPRARSEEIIIQWNFS